MIQDLTWWPHEATMRTVKRKTSKLPPAPPKSSLIREAPPASEQSPIMVNVRAAKDQLSALLDQAARGNQVIITSDGRPKARLVPVRSQRRPFRVDWDHLQSMPLRAGPAAEQLIREERDGRA
jgi:prevent-host-death family protein